MNNRNIIICGLLLLEILLFFRYYPTAHNSTTLQFSGNITNEKKSPFFAIWCGQLCWSKYISDEFYHIWKDLEEIHGWKEVGILDGENRDWMTNDTMSSYFNRYFNRIPDLILYIEIYDIIHLHSRLDDWSSIKHTWLFFDDVHFYDSPILKFKKSAIMAVKNIITPYPYKIDTEYSGENYTGSKEWFTFSRTWLPHSASPSFLLECNEKPVMKIFLSGAINDHYPYRSMVLQMYNEVPYNDSNNMFAYYEHPGYLAITNATRSRMRDAYARVINQYFAAVTDTSVRNYIVAKIFEIPAAGALLLLNSEAIPILARLNWFENVHYVSYNITNMKAVFKDVISETSFKKYDKIRRAGHQSVLKFHTTKRRALFLHNLALSSYRYA